MKTLYIVKTGTTFAAVRRDHGDFDDWTRRAMGATRLPCMVIDAQGEPMLPPTEDCAGIVITGSHAMVSDQERWSVRLETWIRTLLAAAVPVFGICYGHQLLAAATGGVVGYHPQGKEIGTVDVQRCNLEEPDPLFDGLPATFTAHVTHAQTVIRLPPGALLLAGNRFEPHHAFRLGPCAWGVQFHPEYSPAIMRCYIAEQAAELQRLGRAPERLSGAVTSTAEAERLLVRFVRLCEAGQDRIIAA
jgi:GMP synthase (glutamine-hydrolysing)